MDDLQLAQRLLDSEPKMVVLIGQPMFRLTDVLSNPAHSSTIPHVTNNVSIDDYIRACRATDRQISDCVLCMDLSSEHDNPQKLLGLACRTSPRLVLIEHSQSQAGDKLLADAQFFAFGFCRIGSTTQVSGLQRHWYAYSLSDYKQAPEWLNARFWAHPERFDLQD